MAKKNDYIDLDELKEQELTDNIQAVPVTKDEQGNYRHGGLEEGYSWVTNGQQPLSPDYVEGIRGDWGNPDNAWMSDEDWNAVQLYKQQYENAKLAGDQAGMDAAHQAVEAIRMQNYGYSGGADGSAYLPTMIYTGDLFDNDEAEDTDDYDRGNSSGASGSSDDFAYEDAPRFLSKYQDRIDALADSILNRDAFAYDPEADPTYQQYKQSYTRAGQRAMQDALAQVSARTGGLASSYAHSASQQTYNNYMAALADKIPELRQLAYSMYLDDLSQDRQDLSMLQGLDSSDYDRYLEALDQWNTDRDFAYDAHRDTVSDDRWQTQFDYAQAQDALAQKNYEQEVAYHQQQDALDRAQAQQKTAGEQYQQVLSVLEQMVQRGASRTDLQQALEDAYGSGLLNDELRRQLERRYLA